VLEQEPARDVPHEGAVESVATDVRVGAAAAIAGRLLATLAVAAAAAWGSLVVVYLGPGGAGVPPILAAVVVGIGVISMAAVWRRHLRRPARLGFACAGILVFVVWSSTQPSNERDWQSDVAVLPYANLDGHQLTVGNIRNFDYRSETDFTPAYYDRTFDMRRLDSLDLVAAYWMGPAIAHLFLTFGFGDDHLAISIEARKERTEAYSSLKGFFRQYELVYVVGDERDLIRVRTNYRKNPPEDVYLFAVQSNPENIRRLLLDYVRDINGLRQRPRFYNTLTTNCTTMILTHARVNGHVDYSWKVLLSGYAPEYAYDAGRLGGALPFAELKRLAHINAAAHAADGAPDFSRRIRVARDKTSLERPQ
jgi:hypothetical protein